MRQSDGRQFGRHDFSRRSVRALLATQPRRRATLAACAVLLAAMALTIVLAGHAQAQRGAGPLLGSLSEPQVLTGVEETGAGRFGTSAAISADGSTAIVGGPSDNGLLGAAWVFTRSGGGWEQQGPKLTGEPEGTEHPCEELEAEPEACAFGRSVALSANGNVALVGSPRGKGFAGVAWVYTRSGSTWTKSERLIGEEAIGEARFGRSVALSADGAIAVVGGALDAAGHGAVWVFAHTSTGWVRQAKLTAPTEAGEKPGESFFGASVGLSRDGATALVGAPGAGKYTGAAWLFTRTGEAWAADRTPLVGGGEEAGSGRFGFSVALSAEGTTALVGARTDNGRAGAAWAFANEDGAWVQQGPKLTGGFEEVGPAAFGWAVALSANGEQALVGGPADAKQRGAAWLFKRSGSRYVQAAPKIAGGETSTLERIGTSAALSQTGAEALAGAPRSNGKTGAALAVFGIRVPAPTVTSITPSSGPSAGGTPVTIEGSGFLPGALVTIGSEATSVEVISQKKIVARTAATATGSDEVVVSDEYGTSSGGPGFTYEPPPRPVVTSITPPAGPSTGGTVVTIEGSGFQPGVTVTICGQATVVEVVSETKIIARTPATSPGACDVVVSNKGGSSASGPKFIYEAAAAPPKNTLTITPKLEVLGTSVGPPVLGVSGNISPSAGKVFVRLPGTNKFVPLTGLRNIPFGTIVDAREGTATVTTMGKKGLQSVNLYEGEFTLTQGTNAVVVAALYGGNFKVCPTARERAHLAHASAHRAPPRHIVRKLWASGHGTYTTKGNYATGAVLGTVWETIDRCNGTGIHVITDSVLVTNLVTHKRVRVKAGHTYIAKAP